MKNESFWQKAVEESERFKGYPPIAVLKGDEGETLYCNLGGLLSLSKDISLIVSDLLHTIEWDFSRICTLQNQIIRYVETTEVIPAEDLINILHIVRQIDNNLWVNLHLYLQDKLADKTCSVLKFAQLMKMSDDKINSLLLFTSIKRSGGYLWFKETIYNYDEEPREHNVVRSSWDSTKDPMKSLYIIMRNWTRKLDDTLDAEYVREELFHRLIAS